MLTQHSIDAPIRVCRYADAIGGGEFHLPLSINDDVLFSPSLNDVTKKYYAVEKSQRNLQPMGKSPKCSRLKFKSADANYIAFPGSLESIPAEIRTDNRGVVACQLRNKNFNHPATDEESRAVIILKKDYNITFLPAYKGGAI